MSVISAKTKWIATDGWRGYEQPINAVAGANDTGGWADSPCPTETCQGELSELCRQLRKAGIPYRRIVCRTSNVFCIHRYVLVAPEHRERALEIVRHMVTYTRLLYAVD